MLSMIDDVSSCLILSYLSVSFVQDDYWRLYCHPSPFCHETSWVHLSSELTSATILDTKTKTCHKRVPYLKLDNGIWAEVHVCIHRLVIQLQYLVPGDDREVTYTPPTTSMIWTRVLGGTLYPIQHTCLWRKFYLMKNTRYTVHSYILQQIRERIIQSLVADNVENRLSLHLRTHHWTSITYSACTTFSKLATFRKNKCSK